MLAFVIIIIRRYKFFSIYDKINDKIMIIKYINLLASVIMIIRDINLLAFIIMTIGIKQITLQDTEARSNFFMVVVYKQTSFPVPW